MTSIIHFLIINVSPDPDIGNKFSFCFPATTNKELKEFKENAFTELKNLESQEIIPQDSKKKKSVLDTACGDRLIGFLRVLSDATLVNKLRVIKKEKNKHFKIQAFELSNEKKKPNLPGNMLELTKRAVLVQAVLEKNK